MARTKTPSQPDAKTASRPDVLMLVAMAAGFGLGSICFAIGAVLAWRSPNQATVMNTIFVIGAVLFTAAAVVQWRASVRHHPQFRSARRHAEADLSNPDWTASITQLVGTLEFNVMTIQMLAATVGTTTAASATQAWRPDVIGSILFLVASVIAWHPVTRERRHRLISERSWLICLFNLAGSVLFAISAVGAKPTAEGQVLSNWWANAGTLLGGLCFFSAAILLWPPRSAWARRSS